MLCNVSLMNFIQAKYNLSLSDNIRCLFADWKMIFFMKWSNNILICEEYIVFIFEMYICKSFFLSESTTKRNIEKFRTRRSKTYFYDESLYICHWSRSSHAIHVLCICVHVCMRVCVHEYTYMFVQNIYLLFWSKDH